MNGRLRGDRWRQAVYVCLLVVLVAVAVHPLRVASERRRRMVLGQEESPARELALASYYGFATASGASYTIVPGSGRSLEDVPTEAMLLVLGGFRGPYAVYLWMQAEEEKQEHIHFDLLNRYRQILAIQSDYASAWDFMVWNLAWNVSVQWHGLEHKYQWIRRAIELGESGYRRNPHDAEIMATMGRVYLDKLGGAQEAPYYRQRVREDTGRSVYLHAYEWYDRARRANELYGTLGGTQPPPIVYSQACHAVSRYATELTLRAFDSMTLAAARLEADDRPGAEAAFAEAKGLLGEAIAAWQWAQREWRGQIVRWDPREISPEQLTAYRQFFFEAGTAEIDLRILRTGLTPANLPAYEAAGLTEDAYNDYAEALRTIRAGLPKSAREHMESARSKLAEASKAWAKVAEALPSMGGQAAALAEQLPKLARETTLENLPVREAWQLTQDARRYLERAASLLEKYPRLARVRLIQGSGKLEEAGKAWANVVAQLEQAARAGQGGQGEATGMAGWPDLASARATLQALTEVGPKLSGSALDQVGDLVKQIPAPAEPWPELPVRWPARDLKLP